MQQIKVIERKNKLKRTNFIKLVTTVGVKYVQENTTR